MGDHNQSFCSSTLLRASLFFLSFLTAASCCVAGTLELGIEEDRGEKEGDGCEMQLSLLTSIPSRLMTKTEMESNHKCDNYYI